MKTTNSSMESFNKDFPKYLIISIALVQSQLYWFCSALCCVLKESRIVHEEKQAIIIKRSRAQSDPQTTDIEAPELPPRRRLSLDENIGRIRDRPTIQDERTGTTCPPIWWQKTRFKLRQTPNHGNKSIKVNELEVLPMPRNDSAESTFKQPKRKAILKLFHRK